MPVAPHRIEVGGVISSNRGLGTAVTDLATIMLAPTGVSADAEPTTAADLTRRVVAAWRLRQSANYRALGQLLPSLIDQAETGAAVGDGTDRQHAARVAVHTYNAASSL